MAASSSSSPEELHVVAVKYVAEYITEWPVFYRKFQDDLALTREYVERSKRNGSILVSAAYAVYSYATGTSGVSAVTQEELLPDNDVLHPKYFDSDNRKNTSVTYNKSGEAPRRSKTEDLISTFRHDARWQFDSLSGSIKSVKTTEQQELFLNKAEDRMRRLEMEYQRFLTRPELAASLRFIDAPSINVDEEGDLITGVEETYNYSVRFREMSNKEFISHGGGNTDDRLVYGIKKGIVLEVQPFKHMIVKVTEGSDDFVIKTNISWYVLKAFEDSSLYESTGDARGLNLNLLQRLVAKYKSEISGFFQKQALYWVSIRSGGNLTALGLVNEYM